MERNYDEVIAEMLIHLDRLESNMKKFGKRLDLTIQRMVKAEARLEKQEGRMEKFDAEFDSRVAKWGRNLKPGRRNGGKNSKPVCEEPMPAQRNSMLSSRNPRPEWKRRLSIF
ncbi:hypothetical protein [Chryseolinea soli]|uniref:Uncharacterized protein n=1 Tax=Chryseolinea soli TaxID=2321403 RepID=A0A385SHK5_9BACT|nr:hypothetical protein [Chryseolinea soli]AYB29757.1 hypothetical protein D4L85_03825 [Chryseolinea soli]